MTADSLMLQMDLIHFFLGLALILLAVTTQVLVREESVHVLPWRWLWVFGFIHGIGQWFTILSLGSTTTVFFQVAEVALMTAAYLALIEFGRGGGEKLTGKSGIGRWIYAPLLAFASFGVVYGLVGIDLSMHCTLPLIGGIWAAYTLARFRTRRYPRSSNLAIAFVGIALFGTADGLVSAIAFLWPGVMIPVQLVSGVCLFIATLGLWRHSCLLRQEAGASSSICKVIRILFIGIAIIVTSAIFAAQSAGNRADRDLRERILGFARSTAAGIEVSDVQKLSDSQVDRESSLYRQMQSQLTRVADVIPGLRYLYLMGLHSNIPYFLIDTEPVPFQSEDTGSQVGLDYQGPSGGVLTVFYTGHELTEGPIADPWGTWISALAPILDPKDGKTLAVLGMDVRAEDWIRFIHRERLMPITVSMLFAVILLAFSVAWLRSREWGETLERNNAEVARRSDFQSAFTSMVSHEMRTPLSSVKNAIEIVTEGLQGPVTEKQQQTLGIALRNVDRLAKLLNDVLDYAKIRAGRLTLNLATADLCALVNDVSQSLKSTADAQHVDFRLDVPREPLRVVCDADRLAQVLINLVGNAFKFTPTGGRVTIQLSRGGMGILITVSDTGSGISAEEQGKIFEPFIQGHQAATPRPKNKGTGLGLAISRHIVELHRGHIVVQSEEGVGSTFLVTFPDNLKTENSSDAVAQL